MHWLSVLERPGRAVAGWALRPPPTDHPHVQREMPSAASVAAVKLPPQAYAQGELDALPFYEIASVLGAGEVEQ